MSPGWAIEAMSRRQGLLVFQRACVAMAAGAQAFDQCIAAGAFDRRLAGGIDVGDQHRVGFVEAGAELGEEILQPRIAVRLHHGDEPAGGRRSRRTQHGGDLHRVVAVIVVDVDAVPGAGPGETPLHPAEAQKPLAHLVSADADRARHGHGGGGVRHVVLAGHGYGEILDPSPPRR